MMNTLITDTIVSEYNEAYEENETFESLHKRLVSAAEQYYFDQQQMSDSWRCYNEEQQLIYNDYLANVDLNEFIDNYQFLAFANSL